MFVPKLSPGFLAIVSTKQAALTEARRLDDHLGVGVFKHTDGWCVIYDPKRKPGHFSRPAGTEARS
jgi:hypothetical protein